MSGPQSRLAKLASHFLPSSASSTVPEVPMYNPRHNIHSLSPTWFLPRAAAIEPDVRHPAKPAQSSFQGEQTLTSLTIGNSSIPPDCKQQDCAADISRSSRPCERLCILPQETQFQKSGHPLHKHPCFPRSNFRNSCGRRRQRWYGSRATNLPRTTR